LKKTKLIFYAPILEYPPAGGPQLSVINAIKVLSRISDLHIITCVANQYHSTPETQSFFSEIGCKLKYTPSSSLYFRNRFFERVLRISRRVFSPIFAAFDRRYIFKYAIANDIDVFWVDRVVEHSMSIFRAIKSDFPNGILVGDTEAVHSRFILRELPLIHNPIRKLIVSTLGRLAVSKEKELVKKADIVTAVSDIDVEYFFNLRYRKAQIMKFSNVVDFEDFRKVYQPTIQIEKKSVLLLGSFGHVNSPMDRAAKWLAEEIMPIVIREVPTVHLYVIGRNAQFTQKHLNCKNITVVGQVYSVVPYLQKAVLTIVPLRYESGTRFKIIESGAASVACVSTTLGAEGLDLIDNAEILIADSAEDFARAMINVLQDDLLANQLGKNLHNAIMAKYSIQAQTIEGENILIKINEFQYGKNNG